ncbi:MAG: hypothetical protein QMD17_06650 [Rhodocyclaceae bacterium]|nr:hypothetical protein [Rhodocyclaceae bacterium]
MQIWIHCVLVVMALLVADDVVEVQHRSPNARAGYCPELLRDFIEVRGIDSVKGFLQFQQRALESGTSD